MLHRHGLDKLLRDALRVLLLDQLREDALEIGQRSEVLSSEGGASARILPFAMTMTRWQTSSTTSRTCEM